MKGGTHTLDSFHTTHTTHTTHKTHKTHSPKKIPLDTFRKLY